MIRISVLITLCLFIAGCQSPPPAPADAQLKLKDLAPAVHESRAQKVIDSTITFNVYILTVPAERFDELQNVWSDISARSVNFQNARSFAQNGFVAGFGPVAKWDLIAEKFTSAKAKTEKTINLKMFSNGSDRVSLLKINAEKNIFYADLAGQVGGVTVGPGNALLRLSAAAIPGTRGICNLNVTPIFHNDFKPGTLPSGSDEVVFDAVALEARISDHEFILLGPANYSPHDMALANIFFTSPQKQGVNFYLIVCTGVSN